MISSANELVFINAGQLSWKNFLLKTAGVSTLLFISVFIVLLGDQSVALLITIYIINLSIFFAVGLNDKTTIQITQHLTDNRLLVVNQHRIKGFSTLEFNTSQLSLSILNIPRRGPPIKALKISDKQSVLQIQHNEEGMGKENFEKIVELLKELYPEAWPPPKKWRRVI